ADSGANPGRTPGRASPRPFGWAPESVGGWQAKTGGGTLRGEAAHRERNLRDDGDFQADPLRLCPPGSICLITRFSTSPHERHHDGQKITRPKTAGQNPKASTTSIESLITAVHAAALFGRYAIWRRTGSPQRVSPRFHDSGDDGVCGADHG